jgi:CRP-like cAMP-binding protein
VLDQHQIEISERGDVGLATALSSALASHPSSIARKSLVLRAIADATDLIGALPTCRIKPFVPGQRSNVEEFYPGLGSSDCVAMLTGGDATANRCNILFDVNATHPRLALDVTMRWADSDTAPIAGWDRRPVRFGDRINSLQPLVIHPEIDFADEDLGFAHGFMRSAMIELRLTWDGTPIAGATTNIDVCDIRNLGSLYTRVLERVIAPDSARQAKAWPGSGPKPDPIHHPWSPVLIIGTEKAALYTNALVEDIVGKHNHLSNPAWLLRVGVYLELLTCLGIFEAVRDEFGGILTPEERDQYEHGAAWAEIRNRVNVDGWLKEVWNLRKISPPRLGVPRAGAVSTLNLIQKKRATLAFLHVHHEDLKHAIALALPNLNDAQETWQRVFRDAERAVLHKTSEVFPELRFLPGPMREVAMWQQHGVAGQQGLYPTACTQYRASMNHVAAWAKGEGLMDYTDDECISLRVSLLEAIMNDTERVAVLERGDGYLDATDLRVPAARSGSGEDSDQMLAAFEGLLAAVPILSLLSPAELRTLAEGALPLLAVPDERIVVEGAEGDSLYVVAEGEVEIVIKYEGSDRAVDTMGRGAVFGEMALLTGERRNATVRAIDTVLILQIGPTHYEPIIRAHPEWLDALAEMMEDRLRERRGRLARKESIIRRPTRKKATRRIRNQISARFFETA